MPVDICSVVVVVSEGNKKTGNLAGRNVELVGGDDYGNVFGIGCWGCGCLFAADG